MLGSCGTAEGLIVAALLPVSAWQDLFAYQFVPSLLAFNSRQLLTTPPAASAAASDSSPSSFSLLSPAAVQPVVRKAAVSTRLRFLYFAGLEGTGHHALQHLLSSMRHYSETGIRFERMTVDEKLSVSVWEVASSSSLEQWQTASTRLRRLVQGWLASHGAESADGGDLLLVINTLHSGSGFMQSWPNSIAEDRADLHPCLTALASLFESLQADLRIVTLSRAAGSLQSSTALHRSFGRGLVGRANAFYFQSRVLRVNLAALDADLEALDPAFVLDLALERMQREPIPAMQALGRHVGLVLQGEALQQAGLQLRELLGSRPDDAWLSEMTPGEAQLTDDMLAIAAYLPHSAPFRFSAGPVGGGEERPRRRCWSRALRLRQHPSSVSVVSLQGGGAEYLRLLVEDGTGVMSSRHRFDSTLRPSTAAHLARFATANLTAFHAAGDGLRGGGSCRLLPLPAARCGAAPQPAGRGSVCRLQPRAAGADHAGEGDEELPPARHRCQVDGAGHAAATAAHLADAGDSGRRVPAVVGAVEAERAWRTKSGSGRRRGAAAAGGADRRLDQRGLAAVSAAVCAAAGRRRCGAGLSCLRLLLALAVAASAVAFSLGSCARRQWLPPSP